MAKKRPSNKEPSKPGRTKGKGAGHGESTETRPIAKPATRAKKASTRKSG